ncbi:MAG: cupin domain-containing protein [Chloroflexi bacterium]|nr:cupin domain-containing protein [Chloroflexota bacterium]
MALITTGRRLDGHGQPIDGTGFSYDSDGPIAALLAQRTTFLCSQPITGEWIFGLSDGAAGDGVQARGVGIFPPGNVGPPAHRHPAYDESFEIVQGRFVFVIAGVEREARAGDALVVTRGTAHTFRCCGDELGAVIGETRPAARIGAVITTLFGMAHDGLLTSRGQPRLLQALVIGDEYADDTVMCRPPPAITLPLARALAPLARRLGRRATHARYLEVGFWEARVEQPARGQDTPGAR